MSGLRRLEFEGFPLEVRKRIYRYLLIKTTCNPVWDTYESDGSDEGEIRVVFQDYEISPLMIDKERGLYPALLRTNRKIHDEAADVLWGENHFKWGLSGNTWATNFSDCYKLTACLPRHYGSRTTKMHLEVGLRGDMDDHCQINDLIWITINFNDVCEKLSLNRLQILKVDLENRFVAYPGGLFTGNKTNGEQCLEPLREVRAEKVIFDGNASPDYVAELTAVIEGPRDIDLPSCRHLKDEEDSGWGVQPERGDRRWDDNDDDFDKWYKKAEMPESNSETNDANGEDIECGVTVFTQGGC